MPLLEPFFYKHSLATRTQMPKLVQKGQHPKLPGLWNQTVSPLALIPSLREAQREAPWEASRSSDELIFAWIQHRAEPASVPGLACLTNMVLKPKTFKLLPHVKKNRKLRGFSTASMRSGNDNQEKRSFKWLFWSMWKIDTLCAW